MNFKQLNSEIFGKQPDDMLLGNYYACYFGHATDSGIRYNSASGGLVTALLIFALEQGIIDGALVTRMSEVNPLEPLPFIARTREEIISSQGSKYCPVPANNALKDILNAKENEKFAVVGLPCQIHGIRKAEVINSKLGNKIKLHLGIVCSNSNCFHMTDFILWRYGIKKRDIAHLYYRGEGWPGHMSIYLKDGTRRLVRYRDYILFHEFGLFTPRRCTLCYDTSNELSDLSFGDGWGSSEVAQGSAGTSLIISRNKIGEDYLRKATSEGKIVLESISHDRSTPGNKGCTLKARFFLNRLAFRRLPSYQLQLRQPKLFAYPYYLLLYLNMYISSKRSLWRGISPLWRIERLVLNYLGRLFQ